MGDVYVLVEVENDGGSGCLGGDIDQDFSSESQGLEVGLDGQSIVLNVSRCLRLELDECAGTYLWVDIGG